MTGLFGRIHNKNCCCGGPVCCDRPLPLDCYTGEASTEPNALPLTLDVVLTATPDSGSYTCFNGSGTLTFKTAIDGGVCCWEGTITGTCVDCNGASFNWSVEMVTCCGASGWIVTSHPGLPCVQGDHGGDSTIAATTCDPVLLEGCFTELIVGCVVACTLTMPPTSGPTYTLCFQISEGP